MIRTIQLYRARLAVAEEIVFSENGWLHVKTVPFYIFAQAFEGHYEVQTPAEEVRCEPGGAFFSAPGTPLRIRHFSDPRSGRMRIRYFHFIPEDDAGTDPLAGRRIPLAVSAARARRPAAILARLIRMRPDPFGDGVLLFRLLARLYALTAPGAEEEAIPDYLKPLGDWIRSRADGPLTVPEVVARAGYCRAKVFADFARHYRMSPGEFILRARIVRAQRLLLEHPAWSIQQVAQKGGWKNPFHFSRAFKAVTGVAPRHYRRHPLY